MWKVSIVGSLRDREVACSASDRQGSNFESCVWRTVSSQSSHHPQEVLLAQFSLYVHKGGLKPDSFHFLRQKESRSLEIIRKARYNEQCHIQHCTLGSFEEFGYIEPMVGQGWPAVCNICPALGNIGSISHVGCVRCLKGCIEQTRDRDLNFTERCTTVCDIGSALN